MVKRFLLSKEQTPCSNFKIATIILQEERLRSSNYFFNSNSALSSYFLEPGVPIED